MAVFITIRQTQIPVNPLSWPTQLATWQGKQEADKHHKYDAAQVVAIPVQPWLSWPGWGASAGAGVAMWCRLSRRHSGLGRGGGLRWLTMPPKRCQMLKLVSLGCGIWVRHVIGHWHLLWSF